MTAYEDSTRKGLTQADLNAEYTRGRNDGWEAAETKIAALQRERDAAVENTRRVVRDAIVEEVLSHPEDAVVDGPDFADAVMARIDAALGDTNG